MVPRQRYTFPGHKHILEKAMGMEDLGYPNTSGEYGGRRASEEGEKVKGRNPGKQSFKN